VEGSVKGVPPDTVDKLRKMIAYVEGMESLDELRTLTAWKAHILTGDGKGIWSSSVTRNTGARRTSNVFLTCSYIWKKQ
jgi:proteic killer suppression protein